MSKSQWLFLTEYNHRITKVNFNKKEKGKAKKEECPRYLFSICGLGYSMIAHGELCLTELSLHYSVKIETLVIYIMIKRKAYLNLYTYTTFNTDDH